MTDRADEILRKWFYPQVDTGIEYPVLIKPCTECHAEPNEFLDLIRELGQQTFDWLYSFDYFDGGSVLVVLKKDKYSELEDMWNS